MDVPTALVNCATCKGKGLFETNTCPACDGLGEIKVAKPVTPCPHCDGDGKANETGTPLFKTATSFCPVCHGVGWALTL